MPRISPVRIGRLQNTPSSPAFFAGDIVDLPVNFDGGRLTLTSKDSAGNPDKSGDQILGGAPVAFYSSAHMHTLASKRRRTLRELVGGHMIRDSTADALENPARLEALKRTKLLDSPPEQSFDRLTELARQLLKTPVALVSLLEPGRQFFKSCAGLPEPWASRRETPLSYSFCQFVVGACEKLVVRDARGDPKLSASLALKELGVVSYLGVPLTTADGLCLGSFCVIDKVPRDWKPEDLTIMETLGSAVVAEIELRIAHNENERLRRAFDETGGDPKRAASVLIARLETEVQFERTRRAQTEAALSSSESRLRRIFDSRMIGLFYWDLQGNILDANDAFLEMVGYTKTDLRDHTLRWLEMTPPEFMSVEMRALREITDHGFCTPYEKAYVRKDGTQIPVLIGGALFGEAGQGLFFVVDISERKRAEASMREMETRFEAFMDNTPTSAWMKDESFRYVYANGRVLNQFNLTPEKAVGRTDYDLFSAPYADTLRAHDVQVLAGNAPLETTETLPTPRGERVLWVLKFPWRDAKGGRFVGGMSLDITERRALEGKLQQAQKMETLGRMAGGVAHDFNNLLTIILSCAHFLESKLESESRLRSYVTNIRTASERGAVLTSQLLAFARKQLIEPRPLLLNELVRSSEGLIRGAIGENIELRIEEGTSVPTINADPNQLSQVILNLALNARDAMPGGGALTISTGSATAEGTPWASLTVQDTGTGMTEDVRQHLFEPFFTTKKEGRGTGLGLATCYGIIRQIGGTIEVTSEVGAGSRFHILLPVNGDEGKAPQPQPVNIEATRGSETILLVEDEAVLLDVVGEVLRESGYRVIEAVSADQAIEAASKEDCRIDLLLTDVIMPQKSGVEVAVEVQKRCPDVKVLFMSGYTGDVMRQHAISEESQLFLRKPFGHETLRRKVREVLDSARNTTLDLERRVTG